MLTLRKRRQTRRDSIGKIGPITIAFAVGCAVGVGLVARHRRKEISRPVVVVTEIATRAPSDQRAEKWFQSLIEHSSDIVSLLDGQGIILYKSPSIKRVLGFDRDDLVGHHAFEVAHPDDRERLGMLFGQLLLLPPDQVLCGEFRHLHKDGTYRWVEGVACNMLSDPVVHAIVFNYRDITERKRAEAQVQEAEANLRRYADTLEKRVAERTAKLAEMVDELEGFSYSLAHDLRAPLRSMQGFAQLLEEDYGSNIAEQGKDYIHRIITAATRLDTLILDALSYSKLSLAELPMEKVEIETLIDDIIQSYPNLSAVRDQIHVQGPLPPIRGNRAALTQCVSNLLGNAVKFAKPDAPLEVTIRAQSEGAYVRFWFEDNGIGIPKQSQERIFQIFQRLHSTEEYAGTGIGLAIVRKAVGRMQGEVGVKSEPGQGSRFWLRLHRWGE